MSFYAKNVRKNLKNCAGARIKNKKSAARTAVQKKLFRLCQPLRPVLALAATAAAVFHEHIE